MTSETDRGPSAADTDELRPAAPSAEDGNALPGGDFHLFVQKLGYQALIGMGVVENPLLRSKEPNLTQAQSVIDDLMMLRDKTSGNLTADEAEHIERVVGDLQRHYLDLVRASGSS